MANTTERPAPIPMVITAFAIVYLVWGSTYFFIGLSVAHIPPMLVGAFRFGLAGALMLGYCLVTRKPIFSWRVIRPASVTGFLMLCCGNGGLIWAEQYIPSGLAAVLLASQPIWFVVLDRRQWPVNFRSPSVVAGLIVGFGGVLLLFGDRLTGGASVSGGDRESKALLVLVCASVFWVAGSLYSKYKSAPAPNAVNAGWQMLAAGLLFIPMSLVSGEWRHFQLSAVPWPAWGGILYLVTMGSLVGYSAFIWLLSVRPAAQVSTNAYVNPLVAVLLGACFNGERLSHWQLAGLGIILASVLLINWAKYRQGRPVKAAE